MWKIIILTVLLSAVQGANIDDIYGNYTVVLMYPTSYIVPTCVRIAFSEDRRKIKCSCSDGNNSTLVEIKNLEQLTPYGTNNDPDPVSGPMLAVDSVDDLVSLTNITCNCTDKGFNFRSVVKNVNENYMLIYVKNGPNRANHGISEVLLARTLPSTSGLDKDITLIDEVKHKNFSRTCTQEIYEQIASNQIIDV